MERSRADTVAPCHIAIIMDGNGRWAQARNLPRSVGHKAGARNVRHVVEACTTVGVQVLTLYAFSTENWNRPQAEVAFLMKLLRRYAEREVPDLKGRGVRLQILGRRAGLPPDLLSLLDQAVHETRCGQRLVLNLAINYGGRAEIVDAKVLDLFAGTGSVGIEALSRGAERVVFVEKHARAVATIRSNLRRTRLAANAEVVKADVFKYLAGTPVPFDLVYVAPPQYEQLWSKTLLTLEANPGWVSEDGLVIVQIFPKELEPLALATLRLVDERRYGSTLLCFFESTGPDA